MLVQIIIVSVITGTVGGVINALILDRMYSRRNRD